MNTSVFVLLILIQIISFFKYVDVIVNTSDLILCFQSFLDLSTSGICI